MRLIIFRYATDTRMAAAADDDAAHDTLSPIRR